VTRQDIYTEIQKCAMVKRLAEREVTTPFKSVVHSCKGCSTTPEIDPNASLEEHIHRPCQHIQKASEMAEHPCQRPLKQKYKNVTRRKLNWKLMSLLQLRIYYQRGLTRIWSR
ncbi:hypothetical protein OS493_040660, partial [Desmophyllum pertusum]